MTFGSVPFLSGRVQGEVAWITWLYVPVALRRRGLGRRMVEDWQAHLPCAVKEVRLVPGEIDCMDPTPFWEKLGFHDAEDAPWVDYMPLREMCRTRSESPLILDSALERLRSLSRAPRETDDSTSCRG